MWRQSPASWLFMLDQLVSNILDMEEEQEQEDEQEQEEEDGKGTIIHVVEASLVTWLKWKAAVKDNHIL